VPSRCTFPGRAPGKVRMETPIHFQDILLGRAACSSALAEERPHLSIDPRAVTCPACLRWLRAEGEGDRDPLPEEEAAGEGDGRRGGDAG